MAEAKNMVPDMTEHQIMVAQNLLLIEIQLTLTQGHAEKSANGMDRLHPPPRKLRRHRQGGAAP